MTMREHLLTLISEEKEQLAEYSRLCKTYQIEINPTAIAVNGAKIDLLQTLLRDEHTFKD